MKLRPSSLAWTLCLCGAAALLIGILAQPEAPVSRQTAVATAGTMGGDFTLVDQNGHIVTNKSWPGQYQLLYFGFTHCPDVCPLGLNKMAEALNALPQSVAAKIQPLFVTVDPARDTPADLKTYTALFYPTLIGLTGSDEQIEHVKKLFKVYGEKQGTGKDYMVSHTAFTYLMTPQGELAGIYSHEATANEMAVDIQKEIDKK